MDRVPDDVEKVANTTIDAAYKVHKIIGNNLLESAYESCLVIELKNRGLIVENQVSFPILYEDNIIPNAYRIDLLINKCLVVELKVMDEISPAHVSQLLTYLRFSNLRLGLIINFKKKFFGEAVRRVIR